MSANARTPTSKVPTSATTRSRRRRCLVIGPPSERLPDAEVEPDPPRLLLAVDQKPGDRIQLVTDIQAERSDRRLVAQPRTDVVTEIALVDVPRVRPDVARVEEYYRAEVAADGRSHLVRRVQERRAADDLSVDQR